MRRISLVVSAIAVALIGASSAHASTSTVTIGSPLTATFGGQLFSVPSGTWANTVLSEPGAAPTSPVSGTLVR